eukprot:364165-Chlamydomonas_euryale.AAC.14
MRVMQNLLTPKVASRHDARLKASRAAHFYPDALECVPDPKCCWCLLASGASPGNGRGAYWREGECADARHAAEEWMSAHLCQSAAKRTRVQGPGVGGRGVWARVNGRGVWARVNGRGVNGRVHELVWVGVPTGPSKRIDGQDSSNKEVHEDVLWSRHGQETDCAAATSGRALDCRVTFPADTARRDTNSAPAHRNASRLRLTKQ